MARIAAVVLAAGKSARFGAENKLLAELGGRSLIRRVVDAVVASTVSNIVVVCGPDHDRVAHALDGTRAILVRNAHHERGMGSSIAIGVSALEPVIEGAFIVPGDMALLTAGVLMRLIAEFKENGAHRIVYPATPSGEQRNPVLWPRRYFAMLSGLSGETGGKRLLTAHISEATAVSFEDLGVLLDVDTESDLTALRIILAGGPARG